VIYDACAPQDAKAAGKYGIHGDFTDGKKRIHEDLKKIRLVRVGFAGV
jgi:hypothetical protein